jgi:hypothetical protein
MYYLQHLLGSYAHTHTPAAAQPGNESATAAVVVLAPASLLLPAFELQS